MTDAQVVPIQNSPLALAALKSAATSGAGTVIGVAVAGGMTPMLFLTVPAGIIICGVAVGIAEALRYGLQTKLLESMGVRLSDVAKLRT